MMRKYVISAVCLFFSSCTFFQTGSEISTSMIPVSYGDLGVISRSLINPSKTYVAVLYAEPVQLSYEGDECSGHIGVCALVIYDLSNGRVVYEQTSGERFYSSYGFRTPFTWVNDSTLLLSSHIYRDENGDETAAVSLLDVVTKENTEIHRVVSLSNFDPVPYEITFNEERYFLYQNKEEGQIEIYQITRDAIDRSRNTEDGDVYLIFDDPMPGSMLEGIYTYELNHDVLDLQYSIKGELREVRANKPLGVELYVIERQNGSEGVTYVLNKEGLSRSK